MKGRIVLDNGREKILQGVREVFELIDGKKTGRAGDNASISGVGGIGKIVLIGRGLRGLEKEFEGNLRAWLDV